MKHTIDWYVGLMDELDEEFDELVKMYDYIDTMIRPEWSLPPEFTAVVKDVMAVVDTAPSDAVKSAAIAFSRNMPIFSVMPFTSSKAEYDRAQGLEDNLRYQFKRSNKRGNGSVMYDMAESSLRYDTIMVRTDDLAHILPADKSKWTSLQRQAWAHGRFIHNVTSPKKGRYMYSPLGLTFVGTTDTLRVTDAISYWSLYKNNKTDEGRKVAQGLKELEDAISDNKDSFNLNELYIAQTYVIDHDKVCVWGTLTDKDGNGVTRNPSKEKYQFVFADQDNPYGFINWSVRVAGSRLDEELEHRVNPMLAPLYWSKSWDKINLFKSVVFSEPFRRARAPRGVSYTNTGEGVAVDYENGADVNVRTGEDYKPFVQNTLDQGAIAIVSALESQMNRVTGASMIGDTTKIDSRTPFATFAAMVKVALARLDKQNEIIADSVTDMSENMLYWVKKTGVPLESYVESNTQYRSGNMMQRGKKLEYGADSFDINNLGISCKVVPSTPTDRMEQLNMAILLSEKLNMPSSELLQEMGYDNVGLSYQLWVDEFLKKAEVQAEAAAMMTRAQTQAQMEAQQPAPPAPDQAMGAEGAMSQAAFGNMNGAGMNPAMGGTPPAMGAPSMTREAITGQPRGMA
mgnify:FL=1